MGMPQNGRAGSYYDMSVIAHDHDIGNRAQADATGNPRWLYGQDIGRSSSRDRCTFAQTCGHRSTDAQLNSRAGRERRETDGGGKSDTNHTRRATGRTNPEGASPRYYAMDDFDFDGHWRYHRASISRRGEFNRQASWWIYSAPLVMWIMVGVSAATLVWVAL